MTTPGAGHSSGSDSSNGAGKPGGVSRPLVTGDGNKERRRELTPEQGCIGCLVIAGIILVSVIFWGYVFWRNADVFQSPPEIGAPVQKKQQ